jgi:hypothetical protein
MDRWCVYSHNDMLSDHLCFRKREKEKSPMLFQGSRFFWDKRVMLLVRRREYIGE